MSYIPIHHLGGSLIISCLITIFGVLPLQAQRKNVLIQSSDIVTPPSLEANTDALIHRWMQGYSTNLPDESPCQSLKKENPNLTPEMVYRDRIYRLPTAMNIPYNSQVREGIDIFLTRKRALIPAMLSLGDYYFPTIEAIFDKYKLPLELKYLIIVESAMDPTAVSPAGASGLWQFMAPTAKAYGLTINSLVDERLDLEKSTDAAARHLRDLYNVYKDWFMAMAAYNCGLGNLNRAVYRAGGRTDFWSVYPYLPKETRGYVPLFIGAFYTMHYHMDHKICPQRVSLPLVTDTIRITHSISVRELSEAAEVSQGLFQLLNPQYKRGTVPGHISPCIVRLPLRAINRLDQKIETLYENVERTRQAKILASADGEISKKNEEEPDPESPAPGSVEVKTTPEATFYTIRKGDTLSGIAKKHGLTLQQLMQANGIKSTKYNLVPGKKLSIPAKKTTKSKASTSKSSKKRSKKGRR